MNLPATAPGWYGKLPALGDFASRRLPPEWIAQWDGWLAAGLQSLRVAEPEAWLPRYLGAPAWRFALLPGVLGGGVDSGTLRVGTLVPSVDRVGRYFPLVLASAPLPQPGNLDAAVALWHWAGQLEDIAVSALQQDWDAQALEQALAELAGATVAPPQEPPPHDDPMAQHLALCCRNAAWRGLQDRSLWCHQGGTPWLATGLPAGAEFARLFTPV